MDIPKISLDGIRDLYKTSAIIAECPKCGIVCEDDDIYVSSEQVYDSKERRWAEVKRTIRATISTTFVKLPEGAKCLCQRADEHMHRKCFVCGFYWSTDTVEDFAKSMSGKIDSNE
jgi:hypothetical protein